MSQTATFTPFVGLFERRFSLIGPTIDSSFLPQNFDHKLKSTANMFTGIIETLGRVEQIQHDGTNVHFTVACGLSEQFKIDQSVAHDGVCLTVVAVGSGAHVVTAIEETLKRTNLGHWTVGKEVNIERAMVAGARLDGHQVQGHVDTTGTCVSVDDRDGSWVYTFRYTPTEDLLLVDKGSVAINGTSLTVVSPKDDLFSVCIIPYTYEHTTFKHIKTGDTINLEFDVIGKYIARYAKLYLKKE